MNELDFKKAIIISIVGVVIISTFISVLVLSIATGGGLKGFLTGDSSPRVIIQDAPLGTKEVSERVVRADELVVGVVDKASPAVVSIVASKDVPIVEQYYTDPFAGDPFFKEFFGGNPGFQIPQYRQKGTQKQDVARGTGFVVSADGTILTNKHVVADEKAEYMVVFSDGTKAPAKILARDPLQDFAIMKIDSAKVLGAEKSGLPFLTLGRSLGIKIGQSVVAIGNALGEFSNTVSVGIVSGLHRDIIAGGGATGPEQLQELIQTDAAINPGNSGGPLLNIYGEVVGINVAVAQNAQGIGFAIPIDAIKRSLRDVQTQGRIIYPFLGVRYVIITPDLAKEKNLSVTEGVLIDEGDSKEPAVVKDSPAEKAGLKTGDIITEINGEKITKDQLLAALIQKYGVGQEISLKIIRQGKESLLKATLAERK